MRFDSMNVLIFVTDQQRRVMDFPPDWAARNLPGMTRLKRHGLSFERAFTNACMCSPARATMLTGYFPAQHGVKYTLEQSMSGDEYPQVSMPLPSEMPNLATVMQATGRVPVYKGKFHVTNYLADQTRPQNKWIPSDVGQYGFTRWNPQDAGMNQNVDEEGGGSIDNDARFIYMDGSMEAGQEGALAYLRHAKVAGEPFCLVVSLVNPHDVLFYPNTYVSAGYDATWLAGDIDLPSTVHEDLRGKPGIQKTFVNFTKLSFGELKSPEDKRNYLNFYGNLMKHSDAYLVNILDTLDALKLTENTLIIQTADHGEMGLSHNGGRQKCFNFYEQSINVPLIYSNPVLYPKPVTSDALVSHVDFLPTLAALFQAPPKARANWAGVDYSSIILDPSSGPVQPYVVFTYDDFQCGQTRLDWLPQPKFIVSIREERYKLAEYFDPTGAEASEWEMYDLAADPNEIHNIAAPSASRTLEQDVAYIRLRAELDRVKQIRLQPLS